MGVLILFSVAVLFLFYGHLIFDIGDGTGQHWEAIYDWEVNRLLKDGQKVTCDNVLWKVEGRNWNCYKITGR
jgi:hypothetical protein